MTPITYIFSTATVNEWLDAESILKAIIAFETKWPDRAWSKVERMEGGSEYFLTYQDYERMVDLTHKLQPLYEHWKKSLYKEEQPVV